MDFELYETLTRGFECVAGIDEAGRGPLAGPVVAAAVILPKGLIIEGLRDSKKLSEKKREELFEIIKEKALDYSISEVSAKEIDEMNILSATMCAMKKASDALKIKPDLLLIDGNRATGFDIPTKTVVKGDDLILSISAASVLAKVTRDRYCLELAKKYPEYSFEVHKGYGTKAHREAIIKHGPCPEHRMTFLKNLAKWQEKENV